MFMIEVALQCIYKEDYCHVPQWTPMDGEKWHSTWGRRVQFGGFYFWLDWIATLSLLLEVRTIRTALRYSTL
jgi:hypothetical protein